MKVKAKKEEGDFFKLGATAIHWQIGRVSEVETIAGIWVGEVDLTGNYNYVLFAGFEAARSRMSDAGCQVRGSRFGKSRAFNRWLVLKAGFSLAVGPE